MGILVENLINCYQLLHRFGMSDLVSSHVSCRDEVRPGFFWASRFGVLADAIGKEDFYSLSIEEDWASGMAVSPSLVRLHSEIYRKRPDVRFIVHTHALYGVAFAATDLELQPISQFSLPFIGRTGYAPYGGPLINRQRCVDLVGFLGNNCALIMRNHGLLTVGCGVQEAFYLMYYLNLSCRVQLLAEAAGHGILRVGSAVLEESIRDTVDGPYPLGQKEWEALVKDLQKSSSR